MALNRATKLIRPVILPIAVRSIAPKPVSSLPVAFSAFSFSSSVRSFATKKMSTPATATVGTVINTDLPLFENTPKDKVDLNALFSKRKVIVFGVPGAFTPTCSGKHLPGFINQAEEFKKKGVDEIVCVSVNDAFTMQAWSAATGAQGKVRMLSDTNADFVKSLGLDFLAPALGGVRSKRFSMIVEDKKITQLNVEPDNTGATCSLAPALKL